MKDTKEKFSSITLSLHWIIAIVFICMLTVGFYMTNYNAFALFPIHQSTGILLFILILWRVIWRYINGWPIPVSQYSTVERVLARIVHWLLIIGILLQPISGMLMSAGSGNGLYVFGLELLHANLDSAGKAIPIAANIGELGENIHGAGANIMVAAISLHILGALKHHIIDKDGSLRRIFGKNI
ncbi:cytochrome b [Shewanella surugensis]|uniref:Cytochrome b n=1 Tax=Shewanella surugensis TaxID=212020 RepID=A0ABT0LD17_9GAMM|nr:cytochrome b [Shewanella surugensis]MCL1125578.1 cytochrome b [Shewanella surugensis]